MDESFVIVTGRGDGNTPPNVVDGSITPPAAAAADADAAVCTERTTDAAALPTVAADSFNIVDDSKRLPSVVDVAKTGSPVSRQISPIGLIYAPSPPHIVDNYNQRPIDDGYLHPPSASAGKPQNSPSISAGRSPSIPVAPPTTPVLSTPTPNAFRTPVSMPTTPVPTMKTTPVSAVPFATTMPMPSPSARPPRPSFSSRNSVVRQPTARFDRGGPCCCPFGFDCPDPPACPECFPSCCRGASIPPPETPAPPVSTVVADSSIVQAPSRPASKVDEKRPVPRLGMNINWICCYERPCDSLSFCHSASDWPLLRLQASEQSSIGCMVTTPLRFVLCGLPAFIIGSCSDVGRVCCFLDGSIFGPAAERSCEAFRSSYCIRCCICEFPSVRRRMAQTGDSACCWMVTKPANRPDGNNDDFRGPFDAYPVRSFSGCIHALCCIGFASAPVGVPVNRFAKYGHQEEPTVDVLPPPAASMRR